MTKRTKVEPVLIGNGEPKTLVGYKVTKHEEKPFIIPVVDVRRGEKIRMIADYMQKIANIQKGSKFIKPSYSVLGFSYNAGRK